jgi:hypothetical protein
MSSSYPLAVLITFHFISFSMVRLYSNETNFIEAVAEKYRAYTLRSPELTASVQEQLASIGRCISTSAFSSGGAYAAASSLRSAGLLSVQSADFR